MNPRIRQLFSAVLTALFVLTGFVPSYAYNPVTQIAPGSVTLIKGDALTPVQFLTDGTPPSWSLDLQPGEAVPAGTSFDSATGVLSGTPTSPGGTPYAFTVRVSATDSTDSSISSTVTRTISGNVLERPNTFSHTDLGSLYTNLTLYEVISAQGYPTPTLSVSAGQIPNGMSFNATTGELVGTPITTGNYSFTITATNSAGSASQTFSGVITNGKPGQIYPPSIGPYEAGTSVVVRYTTDGNPIGTLSFVSGSTPTGTTYSNGVLSGTATTPGTYTFTLRSTNQFGTKDVAYTVVVNPKAPTTVSPTTLGTLYTTSSTNKTFSSDGIPSANFTVSAGALPAGLSLNATTGALTGTVTATLPATYSFTIRVTNTQGSAERAYSGNITDGASYNFTPAQLPTITAGSPVSVQLETDGLPVVTYSIHAGSLPTGLSLSSSGLLSGTSTVAGAYDFTVRATNTVGANTYTLDKQYTGVIAARAPGLFTPLLLPDMYLTAAVNITIETDGIPVPTLSLDNPVNLPAGLTFTLGTGANAGKAFITGTPTQVGAYSFSVTAVAGQTTLQKTYSGTIQSGQITAITPNTISNVPGGRPYSLQLVGDSYPAPTFSLLQTNPDTTASELPIGLTLSNSGLISGTPTSAGVYRFTVRGTSGTSPNTIDVDKTYDVTIENSAPRNITPGTLQSMTAGVAITPFSFQAEGLPVATWSVSEGALPAGLTLNPTTGQVTGTPTAGGLAYSFKIKATNSEGFAEKLITGHIKSTTCPTSLCIINNNRIKFGNGSSGTGSYENSINSSGLLNQPFYYNGSSWRQLTFATYPLDMAVAAGPTTTYPRQYVTELSGTPMTSQNINYSDFIITSQASNASFGYGKITVSGNFNINDGSGTTKAIRVTHVYELGQNDNFVKMTTSVQNISSTQISNLTVFVGTRDDYVGGSDSPTKTKGNIVDGSFAAITNQATPASVLQITSGSEGVLFYSTNSGVNMSADYCCSFVNAYRLDPVTAPITLGPRDGSYAAHFPFGNIAANDTSTLTWFYAAGATAELASVTRNVALAAAPVAPTVVRGNAQATLSWTAPASQDPIVSYTIRYSSDNGATWQNIVRNPASITTNQLVTGLNNGSVYIFQIAAITQPSGGGNTVTGAWSNSSSPAYIGYPDAPTITSGTGGNGTITVNFSAGASVASPITNYDYSVDGGVTWFTVSPANAGATSVTVNQLPNGGTYNVQVRARNEFGPGAASNTFVLYTSPVWTDRSLKSMAVGKSYSDGVAASPNVSSYTIVSGALPAGLTLNSTTGAITGTPTATGNYSFRIQANNPNANISQLFTGTVTNFNFGPGVTTFELNTSTAASITILGSDSEGLDLSTAGATFSLSASLPAGLTATVQNSATIDTYPRYVITGTPTTAGTTNRVLTITDSQGRTASATITFVVLTGQPGTPSITGITGGNGQLSIAFTAGAAGAQPTSKYQYTLDGGTTWVDFPAGALTSPLVISGVSNGTNYTVQIRAVNSIGNSSASSAITNRTIPAWTDQTLGTISQGIAYTDGVSATSSISGYSISAGALPAGLTLNTTTGVISGTPTTLGNYSFTVRVTNSAGYIEKTFTGRVTDLYFAPTISNFTATAGTNFTAEIDTEDSDGLVITNGVSIQVSGLPAGITSTVIRGNTANEFAKLELSGLPTQPGTYPIVITVTDSAGRSYTSTIQLVISSPPSNEKRIFKPLPPLATEAGKAPGETTVIEGDKTSTLQKIVTPEESKVEFKSDDWNLTIKTLDDKGMPNGVSATGSLEVKTGTTINVQGDGYLPETKVWVYVMSTPILIGELEIKADGSFGGELVLPASLELGQHTLQIRGYTKDEIEKALSVGFKLFTEAPVKKSLKVFFEPNKTTLNTKAKSAVAKFISTIPIGQKLDSIQISGAAVNWDSKLAKSVARKRVALGKALLAYFDRGSLTSKTLVRPLKSGVSGRFLELTVAYTIKK